VKLWPLRRKHRHDAVWRYSPCLIKDNPFGHQHYRCKCGACNCGRYAALASVKETTSV